MSERFITLREMADYGYPADGVMYPLTAEQAKNIWQNCNKPIYCLYPDGTEAMVEELGEFDSFDGVFGMEVQEYRKCIPVVTGMTLRVKMDRPLEEAHYLVPGSFTLAAEGDEVEFDFNVSSHSGKGNEVVFYTEKLDTASFEEAEHMLTKDFLAECSIKDCFIYTGEKDEDPEIHPEKLLAWFLYFSDGTSFELPAKTLEAYHFET